MARVSPFPFIVLEPEMAPHRLVVVAVDKVSYPTTLGTDNGVTVGETTYKQGQAISVESANNVTKTFLVECGGTVAAGDFVSGDASGKAQEDNTTPGSFVALEAGVLGQFINVISAKAFE